MEIVSPELLRRHSCFGGADEESLRAIAMASDELRVNAGQVLFEDGSPADHLHIV